MLFAMNLMTVPGMLVCSIFLISVCMFIVSKGFLISSATVIPYVWYYGGVKNRFQHAREKCESKRAIVF